MRTPPAVGATPAVSVEWARPSAVEYVGAEVARSTRTRHASVQGKKRSTEDETRRETIDRRRDEMLVSRRRSAPSRGTHETAAHRGTTCVNKRASGQRCGVWRTLVATRRACGRATPTHVPIKRNWPRRRRVSAARAARARAAARAAARGCARERRARTVVRRRAEAEPQRAACANRRDRPMSTERQRRAYVARARTGIRNGRETAA